MTRIFLHVYHIEKKLVYNVSFDNMPAMSLGDDVQRIKKVGRTSEGLKIQLIMDVYPDHIKLVTAYPFLG